MPAGDRVIVNRKHNNWHRWRGCAGRLQSNLWTRGQHNVHFARSQLAVTAFIIPTLATRTNSKVKFVPSLCPSSAIRCSKASQMGAALGCALSAPTRSIFVGCCARTASGHAAAMPRSVMNSRRFTSHPWLKIGSTLPTFLLGQRAVIVSRRIRSSQGLHS